MTNPGPDIIAQAAHWAALIDAGDMSEADRDACTRWRNADPRHHRTLDRMLAFDTRIEEAGALEQAALKTLLKPPVSRRRRMGGTLAGILLIAVGAGWLTLRSDAVRDLFPDHRTARGEIRTVALKDGSQLTLDTDGAVRLDLNGDRRRVRLVRGRVLAKVAKDPARPFVVETPHGSATALGTEFVVRRERASTRVTVIHSLVRVCPKAAPSTACVTLSPGQRAEIDGRRVLRLADVSPDATAQWAGGWLEADDEDVVQVLETLRRYRSGAITFDARDLRSLKVTGSFPLTQPDRALEGVARTAGLDLNATQDGTVVVRRRR